MIPTNDETYIIKLYKRIPNSAYEYERTPSATFRGRPMNQVEQKEFRIQKGVNGGSDSCYIKVSNLPNIVKDGDKVEFMGKIWTVKSVGYIFDQARIVNASCLSEEQLVARCPKGINVQ